MGRWRQFHADGPSQGFALVASDAAITPKWKVDDIGRVGYGSPVIATDGTIYVGTLQGDLVAITPQGSIAWRRTLGGTRGHTGVITGSPAIGEDGNIYVITTLRANVRDHRNGSTKTYQTIRSTLHSVDPQGNVRWFFRFPTNASPLVAGGYAFSSPKVWGNPPFIFTPVIFGTSAHTTRLFVLDATGDVVRGIDVSSYPPPPIVGEGPGLGDILGGIWDFISSPVDFDTSGVGVPLEQQFGWPAPTIAVVDFSPFNNRPIILIEDNYKALSAFRFQSNQFFPLWTKTSNTGRPRSTPAVFPNGLIAIGQKDGTVAMHDIESGRELWKPWYKAKKPVMSPPASLGRQIYIIADKKIIVLDGNSDFLHESSISGRCLGAPAVSASFVYVSATDGLHTFSFDLKNHSKNGDVAGGVSSPSISDDGTVYVMDLNGTLWAFGGS